MPDTSSRPVQTWPGDDDFLVNFSHSLPGRQASFQFQDAPATLRRARTGYGVTRGVLIHTSLRIYSKNLWSIQAPGGATGGGGLTIRQLGAGGGKT